MRRLDRTAGVESEVVELQERVRLLTTCRADLAWKALIAQVHSRSAGVVQTLLAACRETTLRRLVDGAGPAVLTHPADEDCVGEFGVQLVLATLRRHLEARKSSSPAETQAPGASERFGVSELRRHRADIRRFFQGVKVELWTSVVQAAVREAGAMVVRVEARCSDAEIESLCRHVAEALEKSPSPLQVSGAGLREVAEYIAAEQLLARLGRRPEPDPDAERRPRRPGGQPDALPTGFVPALTAA